MDLRLQRGRPSACATHLRAQRGRPSARPTHSSCRTESPRGLASTRATASGAEGGTPTSTGRLIGAVPTRARGQLAWGGRGLRRTLAARERAHAWTSGSNRARARRPLSSRPRLLCVSLRTACARGLSLLRRVLQLRRVEHAVESHRRGSRVVERFRRRGRGLSAPLPRDVLRTAGSQATGQWSAQATIDRQRGRRERVVQPDRRSQHRPVHRGVRGRPAAARLTMQVQAARPGQDGARDKAATRIGAQAYAVVC